MELNVTSWLVVALLIVATGIGYIAVKRARLRSAPASGPRLGELPLGWQFYSAPTTLEEPGTVFRIDRQRRRYPVTSLKVAIKSGEEAPASIDESLQADVGIVARFIGLPRVSARAEARKSERFQLEMRRVHREIVEDVELDKVLRSFEDSHPFLPDQRYFVIREVMQAAAIRYTLTKSQVDDLGGVASVGKQLSARSKIFKAKRRGQYVIEHDFPTPMRVLFLPEEIKVVRAGLAREAPQLGLVPVKEVLSWDDASPEAPM